MDAKFNRALDGRNIDGVFSTGPTPKPNGKPRLRPRAEILAELNAVDLALLAPAESEPAAVRAQLATSPSPATSAGMTDLDTLATRPRETGGFVLDQQVHKP